MINLNRLLKENRTCKALTGMSIQEFLDFKIFMQNAGAFDTLFNNDGSMNIYTLYFKYCNVGDEESAMIKAGFF